MRLTNPLLFKSLCYINGQWVHSQSGASIAVQNPADQSVIGHVPMLEIEQVQAAITAAHRAFAGWRELSLEQRGHLLCRWAQLILDNREDLAQLLSLEQGKPLLEARAEIDYAASFAPWFAEQAKRLDGRTIPSHIRGAHLGTLYEPVGAVALLTPWNFPSAMLVRKAAAALAAGCTVVAKPAQETPFSSFALAQLAEQAGFPAGVFNLVLGEASPVMQTLVQHPCIRAVSFTGSTAVGQLVLQAASQEVKKIALELGGNAPFILCDDADLEQAVAFALAAKFQTSGQDCCAVNRFFVPQSLYESFLQRFSQAVQSLKVGPGLDESSQIGPLMQQKAVDNTLARVNQAIAQGARLLTGGKGHELGGWFFQPTVLADVTPSMRVFREEQFAPVAAVIPYDHLEQAITLANATEYGLTAYLCSQRIDRIWPLLKQLQFAMISVNGAKFTGAPIPFGGIKASGLGREGGMEGFEPFIECKYFCLHYQ